MKKIAFILILIASILALTGCATTMNNTWRGAAVGAAVGAVIGSAVDAAGYDSYYGAGYTVRYPTCPLVMPRPIYTPYGIVWVDPPTDPRCTGVFLWYEQVHRQRHPRRW
jgi:hypothetical protein